MKLKNILRPAIATFLILLIPVIGMNYLTGWDWNAQDFIIMGTLVFITGLLVELVVGKVERNKFKIVLLLLIIGGLLLAWVHFAVGIVDTWPFAGS